MGIYERDYVRNRPSDGRGSYGYARPGGIPPLRTWSVNTWLIVACILVFLIDGFLPYQLVPMERRFVQGVNVQLIDYYEQMPVQVDPHSRHGQTQLIDRNTQQVVGVRQYWPMQPITRYLHFSTERGFLGFQFWRFIGFQFLHANFTHLLFNMIGLYFFGPMVERYLGSKRYLAFYLLSGICGAFMYLVLNLGGYAVGMFSHEPVAIPGLLFNDAVTPLVGASAGVFGVLMAGAFLAPNATVLLFFFIPMPLRTLAYALVAIALLTVVFGGGNAGGEAGHLGGAIAGFYFIRHPRHLHNFFDVLGRIDPTSHHYRGERRAIPGKAVSKMRRGAPTQSEVDRVLDKVHSEGLASLSEREKRILRDASERR